MPDSVVYALVVVSVSLLLANGFLALTALKLEGRVDSLRAELERAHHRIKLMAERDEVSGLYSRRFLLSALKMETARVARGDGVFSICIIDLDRFRDINGRHGDARGNEVLRDFATMIAETIRKADLPAVGYSDEESAGPGGGEEFILLLPGTSVEGAEACARRLQRCARNEPRLEEIDLSFSAGVADYRIGESVQSILGRAGEALCRAKETHNGQIARAVPAH